MKQKISDDIKQLSTIGIPANHIVVVDIPYIGMMPFFSNYRSLDQFVAARLKINRNTPEFQQIYQNILLSFAHAVEKGAIKADPKLIQHLKLYANKPNVQAYIIAAHLTTLLDNFSESINKTWAQQAHKHSWHIFKLSNVMYTYQKQGYYSSEVPDYFDVIGDCWMISKSTKDNDKTGQCTTRYGIPYFFYDEAHLTNKAHKALATIMSKDINQMIQ